MANPVSPDRHDAHAYPPELPPQATADSDPAETGNGAMPSIRWSPPPGRSAALHPDRLVEHVRAPASPGDRNWRRRIRTASRCRHSPTFPGDLAIEERLASLMRWNALAMVARANAAYGELGGHIASYASAADLFEVGFNHFFTPATTPLAHGGDWCSSSRTARRASTRGPFSKVA